MDRILCIVSRQHPELFAYLKHRFADAMVTVLLDRRRGPRRLQALGVAQERRRAERRRRPEVDEELRRRSHVILRLEAAT